VRPNALSLVACGLALSALSAGPAVARAAETPTSYGEAARVDTPILRVPYTTQPPTIDGTMEAGEWEDASALSSFWYDFTQANFRFLAPIQTQLQVYAAFDDEHLYIAYKSPVWPTGTWLRARGRFSDVLGHPLYGVLWDDHVEIEFRPYHDVAKAFRLGLLRWDINPINTVVDWNWTPGHGTEKKWQSRAKVRCRVTREHWIIEMAAPLEALVTHGYKGTDEHGNPLVKLPPPDGTAYRCWFTRGIGGNGGFFNVFDAHIWNTTKTKMVFDRRAVSFQINELGPIMEDKIDVHLTMKNHSRRSQTVRLGFFVENPAGTIYSSYDSSKLSDGLVELRPGEVRKINLRQPFPNIATNGNVLWFDVRSAGRPAKVLFRTRLVHFHSMEGGVLRGRSFRDRRLNVIKTLRPPRKEFFFRTNFSSYTKRLSAVVDVGIHGASEEARTATQAKLVVVREDTQQVIVEETRPVRGAFACFLLDLAEARPKRSYRVSVLLFDKYQRIVGETHTDAFTYTIPVWQGNTLGDEDVVWEPYTPVEQTGAGVGTLRHRFAVGPSGLPKSHYIRPDAREVPLEKRGRAAEPTARELRRIGRGEQLRAPMRIEAVIDGRRVRGQIVEPAKVVRRWKSEVEYAARLRFADLPVTVNTRYDCDGSIHCRLQYGGEKPARIDRLELVAEIAGRVTLAMAGDGGMAGADVWECSLPQTEGVIWDSGAQEHAELYYTHFIPWFWFGSADRAFTFYCDIEKGWILDRDGRTITLERDADGQVTWRVRFVNHTAEVRGPRRIDFTILNHPAKPKPKGFRELAWHYCGSWAIGYMVEPMVLPEATLRRNWRRNAGAPKDLPYEKAHTWRKDDPPWRRHGRWRNVGTCPEMDQIWEDKATYWYEKRIRIGRRVGGWWDEYWPIGFGSSDNLAMGNAYLRDPNDVREKELPWHRGFLTQYMRGFWHRISRLYAKHNVPNRNCTWANTASDMGGSFLWDAMLVEECGAANRSYDLDVIVQFPNALYRKLAKNYTGLVTRIFADAMPVGPGDDKRFDRQLLGRALLNDIGVNCQGPHGVIRHREQAIRLINRLTDWGYFRKDDRVERLAHYLNGHVVRAGDVAPEESAVWVTAYRRPLDDGRGCKALLVVMNESDDPVELPLHLLDSERLLGGRNTLRARDALTRSGYREPAPEELSDWWRALVGEYEDRPVLLDIERGEVVPRAGDGSETYGPVYVPYHDFRVLYAEHRTAAKVEK
jgi:hypothetical protein